MSLIWATNIIFYNEQFPKQVPWFYSNQNGTTSHAALLKHNCQRLSFYKVASLPQKRESKDIRYIVVSITSSASLGFLKTLNTQIKLCHSIHFPTLWDQCILHSPALSANINDGGISIMTATFVFVSLQQWNLFLHCPLLPLQPPATTQLMFSQPRTGY